MISLGNERREDSPSTVTLFSFNCWLLVNHRKGNNRWNATKEHLCLKDFCLWNWYPFKHKLTISLKLAKSYTIRFFRESAGRYEVARNHEWETWLLTFDLAYFRYPEITWALSGFLGIRSFRTFWHSTHARTLVGVHTLWISPPDQSHVRFLPRTFMFARFRFGNLPAL